MTSMSELYNNIKTFMLQSFESKREEDINLPIEVERLFEYIDGEMSIVDSPIISELSDNIMKLRITGNSFSTYSSTPFTYNGKVFVDWGDNSGIVEYTGGKLTHTYSSSAGHTVKIYGDITSLGDYCFYRCTGLTSITIPSNVTSLGNYCFMYCTGLTSIILNWTTNDEILTYKANWITSTSSNLKFHIPNGTTSLYTAKGYPSNRILEVGD